MQNIDLANRLTKSGLAAGLFAGLAVLAGLVFSSSQLAVVADASAGSISQAAAATSQTEAIDLGGANSEPDDDTRLYFGNYTYEAEAGDNLTYMVRRSIQIHLENEPRADFEAAHVVAAETHVVQDMGAFELGIGQEVAIDVVLVASQVEAASQLDEATLGCWARYLPIRQQLDFIQPTGLPQVIAAADDSDQQDAGTASNDQDEAGAGEPEVKNQSPLFLAIIGALALVVVTGWILIALYRQKEERPADGSGQDKRKPLASLKQSKLASKAKSLPRSIDKRKVPRVGRRRRGGGDTPKRGRGRPRKES